MNWQPCPKNYTFRGEYTKMRVYFGFCFPSSDKFYRMHCLPFKVSNSSVTLLCSTP